MLTFIPFVIALFVLRKIFKSDAHTDLLDKFFMTILMMMVSFFFSGVIVIVAIQASPVEISRENCTLPIASLKTDEKIRGSFILGSGTISEQEYYRMFAKTPGGNFRRVDVPVSRTEIRQTNTEQASLKWEDVTVSCSKWVHYWPFFVGKTKRSDYLITVPENTVIEKFQVW